MFSKAKNGQDGASAPSGSGPDAHKKDAAKAATRAKSLPGPAGIPSLISTDVLIRGSLESEGEVQFDGEIEGDIQAKGIVIGDSARVSGQVIAEKVRVCGTVEGAIRATRVELAAGALVKGDVIHAALAIEAGARFEGNVRHADDPIGEVAAKAAPRESAATPAPEPQVKSKAANGPSAERVKAPAG